MKSVLTSTPLKNTGDSVSCCADAGRWGIASGMSSSNTPISANSTDGAGLHFAKPMLLDMDSIDPWAPVAYDMPLELRWIKRMGSDMLGRERYSCVRLKDSTSLECTAREKEAKPKKETARMGRLFSSIPSKTQQFGIFLAMFIPARACG